MRARRSALWPILRNVATLIIGCVLFLGAGAAQAQTYNVIYSFTGGQDGANPYAGVTMDGGGNLYGTTYSGGIGYGTVYRLKGSGSSWEVHPLYSFKGGSDGANPQAGVIFNPNNSAYILYGTTQQGGSGNCGIGGCGTVFSLRPSPTSCSSPPCPWEETQLYVFQGPASNDGQWPGLGDLLFDSAGNIYDTTFYGGEFEDAGTVYELTPSGGGWKESILHLFNGGDGMNPNNEVVRDKAGNLYSTTVGGGEELVGTIFELSPSGSAWLETFAYSFAINGSTGSMPEAGLTFDSSGHLYGATTVGPGGLGAGAVFEMTPSGSSWTVTPIYNFTGAAKCGPWGTLVMDGAGNLYGTTYCDGANNAGSIFKLTKAGSGWTYTSLHDFTGGSDGGNPYGKVMLDASGKLYGTASTGGANGDGVVWQIMP